MKKFLLISIYIAVIITIRAEYPILFTEPDEFYENTTSSKYIDNYNDLEIISYNRIVINKSVLNNAPEVIQFSLEGEIVTLKRIISSTLKETSSQYLSYSNNNVFLYISILEEDILIEIQSPHGLYNIITTAKDEYILIKVDDETNKFEPEILPVDLSFEDEFELRELNVASDERIKNSNTTNSVPYIRVLVLYTHSAGLLMSSSSSNIYPQRVKNRIYLDINKGNESLYNSLINAAFELVYIGEASDTEGSLTFSEILNKFTNSTDNYIDEVHSLRNKYAADVCILLVNHEEYCGLGFVKANASKAFAVVKPSIGCQGKYTFTHEIGHIMGCNHDIIEHSGNNPYKYGHGYIHYVEDNPSISWRTMMSYATACRDTDYYCTRIPYWSNIVKTYNGIVMGDATYANNARVWNERAQTVSEFRLISDNKTLTSSDNSSALYQNIRVTQSITTQNGYQVNSGQSVDLTGQTQIRLAPNTHIKSGSNFRAHISPDADTSTYPQFMPSFSQKENFNNSDSFSIFPNPTTDILTIKSGNDLENISIFNMQGQQVLSSQSPTIDVSLLPIGIYILKAKTENGNFIQEKFIKV